MDAARPSPAPIRARRRLRAAYTPPASRSSASIGSTILSVVISRYAAWAFPRSFAWNSATVGLTGGMLLASENPCATRSCLATAMNGPRLSTIWPLLVLTAPLPCPDSTLTTAWCATVLTCTQTLAMAWLVTTVCTVLWMKPVTALAICGPNVVSSELIRVSPLLFSCATAWLMVPVRLSWLVIAVGDLVGQDVLDRRVVDQRLHRGHPPARIGNLVASPYAEHGDRSESRSRAR